MVCQAQRNLEEAESCSRPLDGEGLKERGDARLREGDVTGAIEAYDAVLSLPGANVSTCMGCLCNASLAYLRSGEFDKAIDCCERGLRCE